jgi:hypothetical protein
MPKMCPAQAQPTSCQARDKRQQIVLLPDADHALEELPAIEDADPVEEHDQARQPIGP